MRDRATSLLAIAVVLFCVAGCARHVAAPELGAAGADVGVVVRLVTGDVMGGRLLSLDGDEIQAEFVYRIGENAELRGLGDRRRVVVEGRDVLGEIVAMERDGITLVVRVRRRLELAEIDEMTFHRSAREASLGPIVSAVLGPVVGALLALAI